MITAIFFGSGFLNDSEISKASQVIEPGFVFGMLGLLLFSEEFIANINLYVWLIVNGVPLMVTL